MGDRRNVIDSFLAHYPLTLTLVGVASSAAAFATMVPVVSALAGGSQFRSKLKGIAGRHGRIGWDGFTRAVASHLASERALAARLCETARRDRA